MTRFLSLILAGLLIAGCATKPSQNVIRLDSTGDITLNGAPITREELPKKLDKDVPVIIRVPPRTPRNEMIDIMRAVQLAGARKVNVAAETKASVTAETIK